MKNKTIPLAGAVSLVVMIFLLVLAYNGWEIDAVRPDVNRFDGMVVNSELVDNSALNAYGVDTDAGSGETSMGGDSMEGDGSEVVGSFAECKETMVAHTDYVEYLRNGVVKTLSDVYSGLSSSAQGKLYIRVMYRGHEKDEGGGAYMVVQAGTAFDQMWGGASGVGGYDIGAFAIDYASEFNDNASAVETTRQGAYKMMSKVPSNQTWLKTSSGEYDLSDAMLKMWGAYAGVGSGGTRASQYLSALQQKSNSSIAKYVPMVTLKISTGVSDFKSLIVNDTTGTAGKTYEHSMSKENLNALFVSYNQYPHRDASQRVLFKSGNNLIAKSIDSGYSKLMIIVGSEAGSKLTEVLGERYQSVLSAISGVKADTSYSDFDGATLILKGEVASK